MPDLFPDWSLGDSAERPEEVAALEDRYLWSFYDPSARLKLSDERLAALDCHDASILPAMTYQPDFRGCWAKLDRAKTHRDVLKDEIGTAFGAASNRIGLSVEYDDESGYHVFRAETFPDDLSRRWGILIGDAVHNLRGALDHLVWQLSLLGRDGRNTRNPKRSNSPS